MGIQRSDAKHMVGKGWERLVDVLYDALPLGVFVSDVKEKFGSLRFYFYVTLGGAAEASHFDKLVDSIETASLCICEMCGKSGELRDLPWTKTLCERHYREKLNENIS